MKRKWRLQAFTLHSASIKSRYLVVRSNAIDDIISRKIQTHTTNIDRFSQLNRIQKGHREILPKKKSSFSTTISTTFKSFY